MPANRFMTSRCGQLLPALMLIGCVSSSDHGAGSTPLPTTSGSYLGRYVVPTSSDLVAAAVFQVKQVNWLVVDSVVTIEYPLPIGLVGGSLRVSLAGTLGGHDVPLALSGRPGTGSCTGTAQTITCQETIPNLGVLPISMDVVKQTASAEYAGPVSDRVAVATIFSSDPIGFVEIDLQSPVIPDGSGGGGSGGGGGGSGGSGGHGFR